MIFNLPHDSFMKNLFGDEYLMEKNELYQRLYGKLYLIRRVEEEIIRLYPSDKIKSPVHLSIGQEFLSVGVCEALRPQDVTFGTYRGHALYLAKGGDLKEMIAELYGKETGCARGKGGSMHLVDNKVGMMGTSAIVSTSIPHAAGYALALKNKKSSSIVACFFGDGATEEGVFYETLNFAALKKLPLLFICENNQYAIYTHIKDRIANTDLCARAESFGVAAKKIESGNIIDLYETSLELTNRIGQGEGPFFLEVDTYRLRDHVGPLEDWNLRKGSLEEAKKWIENDQVSAIGSLLDDFSKKRIEASIEKAIEEAITFADTSHFPKNEELYSHVFS